MTGSIGELRLRVCEASTFPEADRGDFVTAPIAGVLLGFVWREFAAGGQIISTPLSAADAKAMGVDAKSAVAAAVRNVATHAVGKLDIMRISDATRLFMFQDESPDFAGRLVGVAAMIAAHRSKLSPAAQKHTACETNGVLVGAPFQGLLMVLPIDGNHLLEGAINLAGNVHGNHDPDAEEALSPWLYWVKGDHIEEMRYELEGDDITSIAFPDPLLPLLND